MTSLEKRLWPDSCGFYLDGNFITEGLKIIDRVLICLKVGNRRKLTKLGNFFPTEEFPSSRPFILHFRTK